MEKTIYRKESLQRISSPEQLNEYIRVTTPSVWLILGAIIILLSVFCIWALFGSLQTSVELGAAVHDNRTIFYLSEETAESLHVGDEIFAEDTKGLITNISKTTFSYTEALERLSQSEYAAYTMGLEKQKLYYEITAEFSKLSDGIQQIKIVTERVRPISFLLN